MQVTQKRLIWSVVLLWPLLLLASCKSPQQHVAEAFHFRFHVEEVNTTTDRFMFDRECDTDANGNIVNVTQRQGISVDGAEALLTQGDSSISQCAPRWIAQFNNTTRSVSEVEITSGDRSRTSNMMTADARLGGMANPQADWLAISGIGRLTAITLGVRGPIRNSAGAAPWVSCTAQFSFQANDTSNPRSVFEADRDDYCELKYTIFDDAGNTAGGQFKLMAKNIEDPNDSRLLIISDGAFSLDLN